MDLKIPQTTKLKVSMIDAELSVTIMPLVSGDGQVQWILKLI
jgi:hypothetical protein